ncbi:MAG: LysR family transcriptional regulator [Eubacteriales bacterium]
MGDEMELFQLKQFITIAEKSNLTKAAEVLYVSQPALSKNLHNLEKSLDCELFDREKGRLILNNNGRLLLEKSIELLSLADEIENIFKSKKQNKNRINVLASSDILLRPYVVDYQLNQNIIIDSKLSYAATAIELLSNPDFDVIIAGESPYEEASTKKFCESNHIERIFFYKMRLHVILPKKNASFDKKEIFLKDLLNIPIVKVNMESGIKKWIDMIEKEYHYRLKTDFTCDLASYIELLKKSEKNLLVSSLIHDLNRGNIDDSRIYTIKDSFLYKNIYIYFKKNEPISKQFVNYYLSNFYKDLLYVK